MCVCLCMSKKWKGLMHFQVIESLAFVACQFILKFCRSWPTFYLYLMTFPQENVRVFHCKRVGGVRSISKSGLCEIPLVPCIFPAVLARFLGLLQSSPSYCRWMIAAAFWLTTLICYIFFTPRTCLGWSNHDGSAPSTCCSRGYNS